MIFTHNNTKYAIQAATDNFHEDRYVIVVVAATDYEVKSRTLLKQL